MPCNCHDEEEECCSCTLSEGLKIRKLEDKIRKIVLEYLYGHKDEKPRKKIDRKISLNVKVKLDNNSKNRQQIAKQKIYRLERQNRRRIVQPYTPFVSTHRKDRRQRHPPSSAAFQLEQLANNIRRYARKSKYAYADRPML